MSTNNFEEWLREHLSIEIAEIGGMTDRESDEFTENRMGDQRYVQKMRAVFDRERAPTPTGIEAAVCADIAQRQAKGIAKYGTTVADNPLPLRDWLQHAYEETLDKAIYLKRAIAEIDGQCMTGSVAPNDDPGKADAARWLPVRTDR